MKTFFRSEAGVSSIYTAMIAVLVAIGVSAGIVVLAPMVNEWSVLNARKRQALHVLESKMNELTYLFENHGHRYLRPESYDIIVDDRGTDQLNDDIMGRMEIDVLNRSIASNQGQGLNPIYYYKLVEMKLTWYSNVGYGVKAGRKHRLMLQNRYFYGE